MTIASKRIVATYLTHVLLVLFAWFMCFPLFWMLLASFKTNNEILSSFSVFPRKFLFDGYVQGWNGIGNHTFALYFINTFKMVVPTVFFTLVSSSLVAYGFARFRFPMKKNLFILMLSTMMLPNSFVIIPRYLLFNKWHWLNTYLPFIVPAMFACNSFFIFMLVQFIRGIPRDLDEAATIDGCGAVRVFVEILVPLMKPALFSAGLFQFMWTWNDFFNTLIYISKVEKYPLSLGLRISLDSASAVQWNQVMAMALLSILPLVVIFFFAQKYFVEGIATSGLKG